MALKVNPPDIVIRPYHENDEKAWLDLHALVVVDSYAWWTAIHKKPVYEKETIDLVASLDETLIGFISMEVESAIAAPHVAGLVWEFGVHRDYRGQNIGRMLIDESHRCMIESHQIKKSLWYTQDDNAKAYYAHLGMKPFTQHWQFCIRPDEKIKGILKENGMNCRDIRVTCEPDCFNKVKENYSVIEDDDPVNPRLCIGFEYIHTI